MSPFLSPNALSADERRRLAHFDQLPLHLVSMAGPAHVVEYVSPIAAPYLPADVVGQPAAAITPGPGALLAVFDAVYGGGQPQHVGVVPVRALAADAPARQLDITVLPRLGSDGQVLGVLMSGLDVTDQLDARRAADEAARRLKRVTENLPMATFICDATGRTVYASPQWFAFTGTAPDADPDAVWATHVHPDDHGVFGEFRAALAEERAWEYEYRLRRHDGQYRWLLSRGVPEPADDARVAGRPRQWYGANLDVTEQRLAQNQLQAKDQELNRLLSLMPMGVATVSGPEHRFSYFNRPFAELLGERPCLDHTVAECWPEMAEQGFGALLDQVYRSGHNQASRELPLRLGATASQPARELFVDFACQALRDEAGQPRSILLSLVDATDRVLAQRRAAALQAERQAQDARLRRMTESLPLITYVADAPGAALYLSPQWYAYTGQTEAGGLGHGWAAAIHPDDLGPTLASWEEAVAGRRPWQAELRFRRHDGEYRWHFSRSSPELDPATGELRGWYGTTQDVHELRLLRDELTASEAHFRNLTASVPQLVWVADGVGLVQYHNPPWYAYTGQQPDADPTSGWVEALHPDDLPPLETSFKLAVAERRPWQGQVRLRRHDGEYRWFLARAAPVFDEAGGIARWYGSSTDVHEQHELALELQRREEEVRFLADAVPQLVWTLDADGHTDYINRRYEEYTGLTLAEINAQGWLALVPPEEQGYTAARFQADIAQGVVHQNENRLRRHDGQFRWFLHRAYPRRDAAGRIIKWYGTSTDVHDQKTQRQRLEAKDKELGQLLSLMPMGVAMLVGPEHCFAYANQNYERLLGRENVVGRTVEECFPEVTAQGFMALLDGVYRTGITHEGRETPLHLDALNGRPARDMFLNFSYQALHDERDQVRGILVSVVDVTAQVLARRQTEELQAEANRAAVRLRQLTSTAPVFLYDLRPDGSVAYLNDYFADFTGLSPERLLAEAWDCVHPDDLASTRQSLLAAVAERRVWSHTFRLRRRDGSYRWLQGQASPQFGPDRALLSYVGASADIHELHEVQQELARREAQVRVLTESIPQLLWTVEADGSTSYVNRRYVEYTGLDLPALARVGWASIVHPDDLDETQHLFRQQLAAGAEMSLEVRLRHAATGEYRWFLARAEPQHDDQGRFLRWFGTSTDVHEQHELQEQLRGSEEQLRVQAESIPQQVWTAGPDGTLDFYNHRTAAYLGEDMSRRGPAGWVEHLHPDDRPEAEARWAQAVDNRRYYEAEFRLRRYDGQYRWFLAQAQAHRDAQGQVLRWYGTNTDIEDQKRGQRLLVEQNARLRRTNEDLDNFVYAASHDLKQPIHNMAGLFQELVRTAEFRDPEAAQLVRMFEQAMRQLTGTVDDLAAIVQVQRDAAAAEQVALAPLLAEVLASLHEPVQRLGAELAVDVAACPQVRYPRAHLQSVLYNLLSNALKYSDPTRPPRIRVRCEPDGQQHPLLTVQDNGLGIDLARHGRQLFAQFARFHGHVEGSGMGLYLVNRIVQQHGGRIKVESAPGAGTTFRVQLGGEV